MSDRDSSGVLQGYVHSVVTGGTVDGPGMRFVIFVSGCPLRCLYCHNPDTRELKNGKLTSVDEIVAEAARYADFMRATGGGVTVTGGEPLFQQDFVTEIFRRCKALGLHTALDTSGYLGEKVHQDLLDVTDLVLLDIKSFDADVYRRVTGVNLKMTLAFADILATQKKPMWVRCVVVPKLTDDFETFEKLAIYLATLGNVEKVEILPFHKMGETKWRELGLSYELYETPEPSEADIEIVREIFKQRGLSVI